MASHTGLPFDSDSLSILTTVRLMRNCLIHEGGSASQTLVDHVATWNAQVTGRWNRLAGRSPAHLRKGDRMALGLGELFITLSVTKFLGEEANVQLQQRVPREIWADLVIADVLSQEPKAQRMPQGIRKARGLARHDYGHLVLTEQELLTALRRA